jgi:hypothetical protein
MMTRDRLVRAAAGCLLGLLACNTSASPRPGAAPPVESLASLGAELHIQFPPSTRLIGCAARMAWMTSST